MKGEAAWWPGIRMCEAPPGLCTLPVWRDTKLCVNHIGLKIGSRVFSLEARAAKRTDG